MFFTYLRAVCVIMLPNMLELSPSVVQQYVVMRAA
jgi:hypothetical protein